MGSRPVVVVKLYIGTVGPYVGACKEDAVLLPLLIPMWLVMSVLCVCL